MKNTLMTTVGLVVLAAVCAAQEKKPEVRIPFFGNEKCPVAGKPVDRDVFVEKKGERVYTCCVRCKAKVRRDYEKYYKVAYAKVKDLKNEHCVVMTSRKAKKDSTIDFQGRRIHTCCGRCEKSFWKAPRRHLAALLEPGLKSLDNKLCPVMAEEPVADDMFVIYRGWIVGICCADCAYEFKESPKKYGKRVKLPSEGEKQG